jgi:hypothetical protein
MALFDTLAVNTLRVGQPKETLLEKVTTSCISACLDHVEGLVCV